MLPTKFWAEMKWTDFSAADMSESRRGAARRCDRAAWTPSPGRRRHVHQRGLPRARRRARSRRLAGPVPAGPGDRQVERAFALSGHADLLDGDDRARLDGDRRERGPDRLPQAHFHEFARRQRRRAGGGGAGTAGALPHAGGPRGLAYASAIRRGCFRPRSAPTAFTAATPRPRSCSPSVRRRSR